MGKKTPECQPFFVPEGGLKGTVYVENVETGERWLMKGVQYSEWSLDVDSILQFRIEGFVIDPYEEFKKNKGE